MFDWDRDYNSVVEDPYAGGTAAVAEVLSEPAPARLRWQRVASRLSGLAGRWAMAAAVALGLGAASGVAVSVPQGTPAQLVAAMVAWPMQVLGLGEAAMPEGLIAYEQPEYENFRRGIARFSDADLLHYLRNAERDMAADTPLADFTRDALYLAHREVDRRRLQRPLASLRDAFGRL